MSQLLTPRLNRTSLPCGLNTDGMESITGDNESVIMARPRTTSGSRFMSDDVSSVQQYLEGGDSGGGGGVGGGYGGSGSCDDAEVFEKLELNIFLDFK